MSIKQLYLTLVMVTIVAVLLLRNGFYESVNLPGFHMNYLATMAPIPGLRPGHQRT